jgi:hypothetical protein
MHGFVLAAVRMVTLSHENTCISENEVLEKAFNAASLTEVMA